MTATMTATIEEHDILLPERRRADRVGPRAAIRIGRVVSAIPVLLLLFDVYTKLTVAQPVVEATKTLGYPLTLVQPIGILLLVSLILYVIPQTAVLGAILLTGYLGGAVASQLRIGAPLATYVLAPVYVGVFLWGGLYLRDVRLRRLVPFRTPRL
jgi:hypothetical protein